MNKIKKLILGLSVALIMAIAFVVGMVGLNSRSADTNVPVEEVVSHSAKTPAKNNKPTSYTYNAGEYDIVEGAKTLSYSYSPDMLSKDTPYTKAYEYVFGSTMNEVMAVNLKYINTTDVNVSYACSSTRLDTTQTITGQSVFDVPTLDNYGDKVYIYLLVSPKNVNIPTTFTQEIIWWFGVAGELKITNPETNETIIKTIVNGQHIEMESTDLTSSMDNVVGWYLDEEHTIPATFPIKVTDLNKLYAKVESYPEPTLTDSSWFELNDAGTGYKVVKGDLDKFPSDGVVVIPKTFNDLPVTELGVDIAYVEVEFEPDWVEEFESLRSIFWETNLTSITLPNTITSIPYSAFSFDYEYTGITTLSEVIFEANSQLEYIDGCAFLGCTGLTSINFPSSITSICYSAFENCVGLTSVDLSKCTNLTLIDEIAFGSCRGLTSITLPSNLESICYGAFSSCYALAEVYNLSNLNITVGSEENGGAGKYAKVIHTSASVPTRIQTIDNMQYYVYGTDFIALAPTGDTVSVILDSRTTAFDEHLFQSRSRITSVDLSGCINLTSIGNDAFYDCDGLTSIDLSGCTSLTSIGNNAFSNCSGLTAVYISDIASWCNISFGDYDSNPLYYAHNLYLNQQLVTELVMPSNITSIGGSAFRGCSGLTSIDLSGCTSLTSIGGSAFRECSGLTSIDLTGCTNLTSIGSSAFSNCSGLTSIDLSGCTSLTSIGTHAFNGCRGLTSIVIPSSVTKIGYYALYDTNLTSIKFDDTSTWYRVSSSSNWNNMTGGTQTDVTNATQNATWFKSTSGYYNYYWYKL